MKIYYNNSWILIKGASMNRNHWILVADKLPEAGEEVEVHDSSLGETRAKLNVNSEWIEFPGDAPLANVLKWRRISD